MPNSRSETAGLVLRRHCISVLGGIAVSEPQIIRLFKVFSPFGVRPFMTALNSPPVRGTASVFASPARLAVPSPRAPEVFSIVLSPPRYSPARLADALQVIEWLPGKGHTSECEP